jgi:hypothetical protein
LKQGAFQFFGEWLAKKVVFGCRDWLRQLWRLAYARSRQSSHIIEMHLRVMHLNAFIRNVTGKF